MKRCPAGTINRSGLCVPDRKLKRIPDIWDEIYPEGKLVKVKKNYGISEYGNKTVLEYWKYKGNYFYIARDYKEGTSEFMGYN